MAMDMQKHIKSPKESMIIKRLLINGREDEKVE